MKTLIAIAIVFSLSICLSARDGRKSLKVTIPESGIENLKYGIHSDNPGLKRSCAYFAGKYQIKELGDDLLDVLESEKSPSNKILIALSLFYIGHEEGINYIKEMAINDENPRVRQMCSAIYQNYLNNLRDFYENYAGINVLD